MASNDDFYSVWEDSSKRHDLIRSVFGCLPDRIIMRRNLDRLDIIVETLNGKKYHAVADATLESFTEKLICLRNSILLDNLAKKGLSV